MVICDDHSKMEYIEGKTNRLFNEWGYSYKMDIYKCLMDDSLFVPLITYRNFGEGLEIDDKRFKFHEKIFETNNIKTLFVFFEESIVYYAWLHELKEDGTMARDGDKIVILKDEMRKRTYIVIDPDEKI